MDAADNSILYVASHGMEDSYRATLIFAAANAAVQKGAGLVRVALLGEATWLVNPAIARNFSLGPLTQYPRPQLFDLISKFLTFATSNTDKAAIGV
ncbi:MAG TPA: hypothetical protein VMS64_40210 [Candidatus Methylomirabilis sp.]|nr:hypothetical protein [Candidatus Methylomirabilis sp.]